MVKWKLMLTTLPYVLTVVVARTVLDMAGVQSVVEFSEVALVLTGCIFLIGFMLSGVMADFKESEKLPGELACTLEAMEEAMVMASAGRPQVDLAALRGRLLKLGEDTLGWLHRKVPGDVLFAGLSSVNAWVAELDKAGASSMAGRLLGELHNLRKGVTRIRVISRTGFLASGYALLETLVASNLLLMLLSRFKSVAAEYTLIVFVSLIFIYMLRLIRDVDDPFDYAHSGTAGAAEVDLYPLEAFCSRLRGRVGAATVPTTTGQ